MTIDGLGPDLLGTGLDERGRRWTVRGTPVGATVSVVGRPKAGIRIGTVAPSPDAVSPRCAQFGLCGGCQLQEMPLDRQRAEKHRALAALLSPLGGEDHGIVGAPEGYGFRNKLELSFGVDRYLSGDDLASGVDRAGRWLGFHAPGRFDRVVDAPRCELASEAMNGVIARVRSSVEAAPWAAYDHHTHAGFFRHLVLREGASGEVLAALHTTPGDDAQAAWISREAPGWGAAGVSWVENAAVADKPDGVVRATFGASHLGERLGDVAYRLSPTAFFQVNRAGAEVLLAWVRRFLTQAPVQTLWDLYCGTGALGLACARDVERLVGVEQNPASVEDARVNAAANGITHATFHAGNVEDVVPTLPIDGRLALLVDPPRIGLHPRALSFLSGQRADVLVYVACRPSSLLRDGIVLRQEGWRCTDRVAVDLFPQTAHVEVVSRWVRD